MDYETALAGLICDHLYRLNFAPKDDQISPDDALSRSQDIIMYLNNTIFSLVNTCLNSSFLSVLINGPAYLMGQLDDLLIKLIFTAEPSTTSSLDVKNHWIAAKQVLLLKAAKKK